VRIIVRRTAAIVVVSAAALAAPGTAATADRGNDQATIVWPSAEFRDLQSAVDAAPDGATIEIEPGLYRVDEPIIVSGKKVIIRGAGSRFSGDPRVDPVTHLFGPTAGDVLDERGNLVLRADRVRGLLNFVGADASVSDIRLSGFDAGIVIRDSADRPSARARISDVVISDTGRGILSTSAAGVTVADATIENTQWNGIAAVADTIAAVDIQATNIFDTGGSGIYVVNANAVISDVEITGAEGGAISGFQSFVVVEDSQLVGNYRFGIGLLASSALISGNHILDTFADAGMWGDGVVLVSSGSLIQDNIIHESDRAGISFYGSTGFVTDNSITCCGLGAPLVVTEYGGQPSDVTNGGGNVCGCQAFEVCTAIAEGGAPSPPELDGTQG
jgi:hypothetical protein